MQSAERQTIMIAIATVGALIAVTVSSMIFLQQLVGIFYATFLNGVFIAAIVIAAARWVHIKLTTAPHQ
jgi:hypothetical protein